MRMGADMNRWMKRCISLIAAALVSLAVQSASTITYYHNDLTGSPVVATDANGLVIWRESYRPYGERLTKSAASAGNDVWFTSRRQDVDTGLVYMGARFYDPVLGRFLSTDPKGFDEANIPGRAYARAARARGRSAQDIREYLRAWASAADAHHHTETV